MKMLIRALVFLALLFAVLYVGMNNTHQIDFVFPVLSKEKVHATAAFLYFGMFAIGVIAGVAIAGSAGGGKKSSGEAKR